MTPTITWLHLSDLHSNSPQTGWDAHRVTSTLVDDLKSLNKGHGLTPDLIFFTGDLAWGQVAGSRIADQLDKGKEFLDSVRHAFSPAISEEQMFLVPGNHDVDREEALDQLWPWLDAASRDEIDEMMKRGDRGWGAYVNRQRAYLEFLKRHNLAHLLADPLRLIYTARRKVGEHIIGIAGFNTAWSCGRKQEKAKLRAAGHFQLETLDKEISDVDFKIALLHHPSGWFHDSDNNEFWKVGIQKIFHVALHGHEHTSWIEKVNEKLTISAGACYERSDRPNGYSIVRLFPQEQRGEVWLRRYDSRGRGWVGDVIHGSTNQEGVWPLPDLRWLKSSGPIPAASGSVPSASIEPGNLSIEALLAKANALHKHTEAVFGTAVHVSSKVSTNTEIAVTAGLQTSTTQLVIQQNIYIVQAAASQHLDPLDATDSASEIKPKLNEIQKQLDTLMLLDAEKELNELLLKPLAPRDGFRVRVKLGHLWALKFDPKKAAQFYRDAVTQVASEDNHARYFSALAAEAEGATQTAHDLISKVIEDAPDFEPEAVTALWIRTAPRVKTAKDIKAHLGERGNAPEVLYTLASRAAIEGDLNLAVELGRRTVAERSQWLDAKTALAGYLIQQRFGPTVVEGTTSPPASDWQQFGEVQRLLTSAIALIERSQSPAQHAMLLKNYGLALAAVGKFDEAVAEYRRAFEIDDGEESLFRFAVLSARTGAPKHAIDTMQSWLASHDSVKITLLLAQTLSRLPCDEKAPLENVGAAIQLLKAKQAQLDASHEDFQDLTVQLAQLYAEGKKFSESRELLNGPAGLSLSSSMRLALLANTENEAGNAAEALTLAQRAADTYSDPVEERLASPLAHLLESLGDPGRAGGLWERLAKFRSFGDLEKHAIRCAIKAKDLEAVIRYGKRLRCSNVVHQDAINAELWALEQISPDRLIATLQEILSVTLPEVLTRELTTQLSYTAAITGQEDLVITDPHRLLRVGELRDANIGRMVVEVLRRGPNPIAAVHYAYSMFRRFEDSVHASLGVIFASGMPNHGAVDLPVISTVRPGSALRYRETDTGIERWTIIEDLPNPRIGLLERSPEDKLSKEMLGKRTNDTFSISPGSSARSATVLEIVDKHIFRYRDCIENFEVRFPGRDYIRQLPLGNDPMAVLLRQVEEREKRIEQLKQIYRDHRVPLHLFATALGRTVFETTCYVAGEPSLILRTCRGTIEERVNALSALSGARGIVLDVSSLAILFTLQVNKILDFAEIAEAVALPLAISEHTLADIRETVDNNMPNEHISIGVQQGRLVRDVVSKEVASVRHQVLRDFLKLLQSRCTVVPAERPSSKDLAWYTSLEQAFGVAGAESVRIAKARGFTLWTEEVWVHELARGQIGAARIWTNVAMEFLSDRKVISSRTMALTSLLLFGAGWEFIGVSSEMLLEGVRRADYKPYREPLSSLLRQYSNPSVTGESAVNSVLSFLTRLWMSATSKSQIENAKSITARLSAEIIKRPDGLYLLHRLAPRLLKASGITRSAAKEIRRVLRGHGWASR